MNYVIEEVLSASQQNRPTVLLTYEEDLFLAFSNGEDSQFVNEVINCMYALLCFYHKRTVL